VAIAGTTAADVHLTMDSRNGETRLSCHRFRSNQVRLALSLLAYNLGNLWRRLALPRRIENWSLTSLKQRLVKSRRTAGKACPLLLASPGGRASERYLSSQQRHPVDNSLGEGEVLQKWRNVGQFRRCWFRSRTVGGGPDENCFTVLRTSEMGIHWVPFLRSKKGDSRGYLAKFDLSPL
jgi:hypothetical protein